MTKEEILKYLQGRPDGKASLEQVWEHFECPNLLFLDGRRYSPPLEIWQKQAAIVCILKEEVKNINPLWTITGTFVSNFSGGSPSNISELIDVNYDFDFQKFKFYEVIITLKPPSGTRPEPNPDDRRVENLQQ